MAFADGALDRTSSEPREHLFREVVLHSVVHRIESSQKQSLAVTNRRWSDLSRALATPLPFLDRHAANETGAEVRP